VLGVGGAQDVRVTGMFREERREEKKSCSVYECESTTNTQHGNTIRAKKTQL
jgi:hypothetical protein